MKYLGIDYGSKRVGLAESDDNNRIAFPITIIDNKTAVSDCLELIKALNIGAVVIGYSTKLSGEDNKINEKIKSFAKEIGEKSGKDIIFEKEWMSSISARSPANSKNQKNKTENKSNNNIPEHIDDRAAAIILQRYLDKINQKDNFNTESSDSLEEMGENGMEI